MISKLNLIPGLHAPIDPKEWNLTLWEDHAVAVISSEPAVLNTGSSYSAKDFEQLFEVDMDAFWHVATKRIEEATGKEADEDDIEEALEPIAQATAAKLVLAYQCHDTLVKALEELTTKLVIDDEEGLIEYAEPVIKAFAALAKARGEEAGL